MKYFVPTDFSSDSISRLNKKEVYSIYGKLAADFIGGGRASFILPEVSKNKLKNHVEEAHRNGVEFNYLLNGVCLGNREYTASGRSRIRELLDWLVEIRVDSVTVVLPFLADLIRKKYPQLKIHVSVCANVNSVQEAKYWQDFGAEVINLQSTTLNRDFKALGKIRGQIDCKLSLIANNVCLYACPFVQQHYTSGTHSSQDAGFSNTYPFGDYSKVSCTVLKFQDPVNIIRSIWIRPEDVHYYEEIGIDYLKFSGRNKDADFISKIVNAYLARSYEGNLVELFPFFSQPSSFKGIKKYIHFLRYLFKMDLFMVNMPLINGLLSNNALKVYIDNKALDGFLEFFVKGNCKQGLCDKCGYCREVAQRVVKIDQDYREKIVSRYRKMLDYMLP